MKKHLLAILVFFLSTSAVRSQEKMAESQQAVQNTVIKLFDALANRDSAALRSCCTSDILIFENGQVWNIDTLVQGIRMNQATDFKRINTIDFINTKLNKDIAWSTYNNQAEIIRNGKHVFVKWMETVILVKEEKTWKVKVLHSTLIKRS